MKTKAFTLVELLVVIAIIGIISTIAYTQTNSARLKARESALAQYSNSIRDAVINCEVTDENIFANSNMNTFCPLISQSGMQVFQPILTGGKICNNLEFKYPQLPEDVTAVFCIANFNQTGLSGSINYPGWQLFIQSSHDIYVCSSTCLIFAKF